MPNPNDNLKLTGDTHAPEIEDDLELEEGGAGAPRSAVDAGREDTDLRIGGGAADRAIQVAARGEGYVEAAREQVRSRPLAAAAVAFFAGFALAVVTRSNR